MQTKRCREDEAGPRAKRFKLVDGSDMHDDTSVHDFRRVQIVHKRKQNLAISATLAKPRVERQYKEAAALLRKSGFSPQTAALLRERSHDPEAVFDMFKSSRVQVANKALYELWLSIEVYNFLREEELGFIFVRPSVLPVSYRGSLRYLMWTLVCCLS
jgi:hypothetical protein